jgi:hypothetical protein
MVCLDTWASSAADVLDAERIIRQYPQGQLLVAGWASIEPAIRVRELASQNQLYVETFLAAVYPIGGRDDVRRLIAIVPQADVSLPPADVALNGNVEALVRRLPTFSMVLTERDVPRRAQRGTAGTFALTMRLWERLHMPFLNAGAKIADPLRRIEAYRGAIRVDYACEKAHQWLALTALQLARQKARSVAHQ